MGKNDMAVAAGPRQLGAICRPGEVKDTERVGFFHGVGPLDDGDKRRKKEQQLTNPSYWVALYARACDNS